jgi:hypothetical protein
MGVWTWYHPDAEAYQKNEGTREDRYLDHPVIFRGYPKDQDMVLKSYEETLEFINNNYTEVLDDTKEDWTAGKLRDKELNQLKEFWGKYPKGCISFG